MHDLNGSLGIRRQGCAFERADLSYPIQCDAMQQRREIYVGTCMRHMKHARSN